MKCIPFPSDPFYTKHDKDPFIEVREISRESFTYNFAVHFTSYLYCNNNNGPIVLATRHQKNASNDEKSNSTGRSSTSGSDNDNDKSSSHKNKATSNSPDPDHDSDNDYKTLTSSTSNSTVSPDSGTTSTTTPTPVENNKEEPIKDGPVGICLVGVKSACNGPAFDHP